MDTHRNHGTGLEITRRLAASLLAADDIGSILRDTRKAAGLSQKDVADSLGLSTQAVCQWETGANEPTRQNLRALCALFEPSYISNISPAISDDQRLAEAYRNLESIVALLTGAASLVDLAVHATLGTSDTALLKAAGLRTEQMPGWFFYALTPERGEALHHALNHMQDVVKELDRQFFATLEAGEVAA